MDQIIFVCFENYLTTSLKTFFLAKSPSTIPARAVSIISPEDGNSVSETLASTNQST
jgi:hypothetical protein